VHDFNFDFRGVATLHYRDYNGDGNFDPSTSAAFTQTVTVNGTTTAVLSSANPSVGHPERDLHGASDFERRRKIRRQGQCNSVKALLIMECQSH